MVIEDSVLIDAVRSHREIYDKSHPGFKVAAIKDAAWAAVSVVVSAPLTDCSARWQTLRERYNKEKRRLELLTRSGSGAVGYEWNLYEFMEFLKPHIRKRKGIDNLSQSLAPPTAPSNSQSSDENSQFSQLFNGDGHLVVYHDSEDTAVDEDLQGEADSGEGTSERADGNFLVHETSSSSASSATPQPSRASAPQTHVPETSQRSIV